MRSVMNILLLLVMLASPLAMRPADAATSHATVAQMTEPHVDHCPPAAPDRDSNALGGCAMACASALPIVDRPVMIAAGASVARPFARGLPRLDGLAPEAVDPPPRLG